MNIRNFVRINENILDPIKDKLTLELWNNEMKLKKSVKIHILKMLETTLKSFTDKKPTAVMIHGSLTGYQYMKTSDLDVMFVIDLSDAEIEDMRSKLPRDMFLPGTQHPINWYPGNTPQMNRADEVRYDVLKDRWVVKPKELESTAPAAQITSYRVVIEMARFFLAGLDSMITEYRADVAAHSKYSEYFQLAKSEEDKEALQKLISFKLEEIISDIDGIRLARHLLKSLRTEGYAEEPFEIHTKIEIMNKDYNIANVIFKYVEELGYFESTQKIVDDIDNWVAKREKT
jgi:hypothetical protein